MNIVHHLLDIDVLGKMYMWLVCKKNMKSVILYDKYSRFQWWYHVWNKTLITSYVGAWERKYGSWDQNWLGEVVLLMHFWMNKFPQSNDMICWCSVMAPGSQEVYCDNLHLLSSDQALGHHSLFQHSELFTPPFHTSSQSSSFRSNDRRHHWNL
jgi:hypothetical protein